MNVIDKILDAVYARRSRKACEQLGSALGGCFADFCNNLNRAVKTQEDLGPILIQIAQSPVGQAISRRLFSEPEEPDAHERRIDFYEAWMAHKAAGFDSSRVEADRVAALYGVEAPPFEGNEAK